MDLLSLVLTLRPARLPEDGHPAPVWWARAAHALLLDTVRRANDVLAAKLHDENGAHPFTVSTLMGRFGREGPLADQTYKLRMTAFQGETSEILGEAAESGPLARGAVVELDYLPFEVVAADWGQAKGEAQAGNSEDMPWAAQSSFSELSAPFLLGQVEAPRRIGLQFTSPTSFKSGGMQVPMPLPGLVFGSLLERWNAYAPVVFPPEVRRYAEECLAVSQYHLSTRPVTANGGLKVGAVGEVTYVTLNHDRYWMSVLATLAAFALYGGVGAGTSSGMGQARAGAVQRF